MLFWLRNTGTLTVFYCSIVKSTYYKLFKGDLAAQLIITADVKQKLSDRKTMHFLSSHSFYSTAAWIASASIKSKHQ